MEGDLMESEMSSLSYVPVYSYNRDCSSIPSTLPWWKKTGAEQEYYEIEVYADTNRSNVELKDFDGILNMSTFTCHICKIDVPRAYSKEHIKSMKHETCLRITNIALDRTKLFMKSSSEEPQLKVEVKGTYFCEACAAVVQNSDESHLLSKKHVNSVKNDELMQKLLEIYENSEINDEIIDTLDFSKDKHEKSELYNESVIPDSIVSNGESDNALITENINPKESNKKEDTVIIEDIPKIEAKIPSKETHSETGKVLKDQEKLDVSEDTQLISEKIENAVEMNIPIKVEDTKQKKKRKKNKNKKAITNNADNSEDVNVTEQLSTSLDTLASSCSAVVNSNTTKESVNVQPASYWPRTYDELIHYLENVIDLNIFCGNHADSNKYGSHAVKALSKDTVEVTVLNGDKIRVPFKNFIGSDRYEAKIVCWTCPGSNIGNVEEHIWTEQHMIHLMKPIGNRNGFRHVDNTWYHCILCNTPFLKCQTKYHTYHRVHIANLKKYVLPT